MDKMIRGEITKYLDEKADETVDRGELQGIVEQAIQKILFEIRMNQGDEEGL